MFMVPGMDGMAWIMDGCLESSRTACATVTPSEVHLKHMHGECSSQPVHRLGGTIAPVATAGQQAWAAQET